MKLALMFSGQSRMFKSAYPSIKQHILDKFDCDIYIHSWIKSNKLELGMINSFRYDDEGTLEEYINLYNPRNIKIEYFDDKRERFFDDLSKNFPKRTDDNHSKRYISMLYGIYESYKLVSQGKNYDYLVRIRPDIKLNNFDIPKKEDLLIDHYGNGSNLNAPGDVLACGKPIEMRKYCDLYNQFTLHYYIDDVPPDTEVLLEHHIKKNNLRYELSNYVDSVVRPEIWTNSDYRNKR